MQFNNVSLETEALIVIGCSVFYVLAYNFNSYLFEYFAFSKFVSWVFIPSGLQLLLVLVFLDVGAVAVMTGSVFINYSIYPDEHIFNCVVSLISGASPLLAYVIAKRLFGVDSSLTGLNSRRLFQLSVLFALVMVLTL
jgi:hypothetical protein